MDRTSTTDAPSTGDDSIKVGTTGTIGSLMSREIDSMNGSAGAPGAPPAPMKQQSSPVSVPCGAISRKIVQHRNSQNDSCSNSSGSNNSSASSSSNGRSQLQSAGAAAAAQKPRKNAHQGPMLESVGNPKEGNHGTKKTEKKDRIRIVEVVDLKCNNPMSSRLRKLGFSKLSETIS